MPGCSVLDPAAAVLDTSDVVLKSEHKEAPESDHPDGHVRAHSSNIVTRYRSITGVPHLIAAVTMVTCTRGLFSSRCGVFIWFKSNNRTCFSSHQRRSFRGFGTVSISGFHPDTMISWIHRGGGGGLTSINERRWDKRRRTVSPRDSPFSS